MNSIIWHDWLTGLFLILQPKSRSFRAKCAATSRVVSTMAWSPAKAAKASFDARRVRAWWTISAPDRKTAWLIGLIEIDANPVDYKSVWHWECPETVSHHIFTQTLSATHSVWKSLQKSLILRENWDTLGYPQSLSTTKPIKLWKFA